MSSTVIVQHPYRPFYVRDESEETLESFERLWDETRYDELIASIDSETVLPKSLFSIGELMDLQYMIADNWQIVLDGCCIYFLVR